MSHPDHPPGHYNRVTGAWTYLLGENFHYGLFDADDNPDDDGLKKATHALTAELFTALEVAPGHRVLDVGCGTGNAACQLAANEGCTVVGISTSEEGLSAARKLAADRNLTESVRFELRDGMDNGFPDGSFDRVLIMECSHLMPDKSRLIRDSARVLAPDGRLALCDIIRRRTILLDEVVRRFRTFDLLNRVYGRAKMESLEFYAGELEGAGLEVVRRDDVSARTRPTFSCWRRNAAAFREPVEKLVGAEYLTDFIESCELLEGLWDDGTLGYGLIAATKAPAA